MIVIRDEGAVVLKFGLQFKFGRKSDAIAETVFYAFLCFRNLHAQWLHVSLPNKNVNRKILLQDTTYKIPYSYVLTFFSAGTLYSTNTYSLKIVKIIKHSVGPYYFLEIYTIVPLNNPWVHDMYASDACRRVAPVHARSDV